MLGEESLPAGVPLNLVLDHHELTHAASDGNITHKMKLQCKTTSRRSKEKRVT